MAVGSLEIPIADVHATRPEIGPHGPPAASADVVRTKAEVVMTVTVVVMTVTMPMTMTVATVHAMTAMAVAMSAMSTTVPTLTTSRSGGDGSSGQSECGDGRESDFTKH